jgi:hypothetical protein
LHAAATYQSAAFFMRAGEYNLHDIRKANSSQHPNQPIIKEIHPVLAADFSDDKILIGGSQVGKRA